MADVIIDELGLQNIANSLRYKLNTSNTFLPSEMGPAINNIISAENVYEIIDGSYLFANNSRLNLINSYLPYCSNITNAYSMFMYSNIQAISNINTHNVTNAYRMFRNCSNLKTISSLNLHNCTNIKSMFTYCNSLTDITISNFDKVNNLYQLFAGCSNLVNINLPNTKNITSMYTTFAGCKSLVDVPQYDTSNISEAFTSTFEYCNNLSDASVQNIINMCLNSNITNNSYKILNTQSNLSPFYQTNITYNRYSNRVIQLSTANWTL